MIPERKPAGASNFKFRQAARSTHCPVQCPVRGNRQEAAGGGPAGRLNVMDDPVLKERCHNE